MIYSKREFAQRFVPLHPGFKKAFDFLIHNDLKALEIGRHEIEDDNNVYAIVQEYLTKGPEDAKFEAHRNYIDIQYMVNGNENMGIAMIDDLRVTDNYDEEKDFLLLSGAGNVITVHENEFCVFFPEDAHMPGLSNHNQSPVRKIVVKVKV